jgi:hypothetical protein
VTASAPPSDALIAGDRVHHFIWGDGKVISSDGEKVMVGFDTGDVKTIRSTFLTRSRAAPETGTLAITSKPETAPAPRPARTAANDNNPRPPFRATWFDNIEEDAPKEEIIRGVFGVNEFSYVVGPPGSGKSAIVTDAACHVASGRDWFGRPVKQGIVVFIAAEREKLTMRRMMAFKRRHGVKDVPLLVLGGRFDLTANLTNAKEIVHAIQVAERECEQKCVWVIIDTLSRSFGAGDQNASKDMGKYVAACDEILDQTDAHLTVIHHTGWAGDRAKGAIDLDGAVDSSFIVKKTGQTYTLTCDGTNDGEEGPVCNYAMEGVRVGTGPDGEPTMAPVIVPARDIGAAMVEKLKGNNARALAVLRDIVASDGVVPDGPGYPDACLVVSEEQWRLAYAAGAGANEKADTVGKQFRRCKESLISSGHVTRIGEWYFPD